MFIDHLGFMTLWVVIDEKAPYFSWKKWQRIQQKWNRNKIVFGASALCNPVFEDELLIYSQTSIKISDNKMFQIYFIIKLHHSNESNFQSIWLNCRPLRSFRLKKRSSALGINKTSESPPAIRRGFNDGYNSENESGTYDPKHRASEDFLRNGAYRTSLQNM